MQSEEKNANTFSLQRNAKVTAKGFQTSGFDNRNGIIEEMGVRVKRGCLASRDAGVGN